MAIALITGDPWKHDIEEWRRLGLGIDGAEWERAELAASLRGKYGEDAYRLFADEVGSSRSTVYRYARIFDVFSEKSHRWDNLSFTHYGVAVESSGSADAARKAAELASRSKWNVRALRAHLRSDRPGPPEPDPDAETCSAGMCGPATDAVKLLHVAGIIEKFYSVKDYDIGQLIAGCMRKDLRNQSKKIAIVSEWLGRLQDAIRVELAKQSTRTQEVRNEA